MAKTYSKSDDKTLVISEQVTNVETISRADIEATIASLQNTLNYWNSLLVEAQKLNLTK